MPYTVIVKDGAHNVHVYQVGQSVAFKARPASVGEVVGVVVNEEHVGNVVRWPGGIKSTHEPGELQIASADGER